MGGSFEPPNHQRDWAEFLFYYPMANLSIGKLHKFITKFSPIIVYSANRQKSLYLL